MALNAPHELRGLRDAKARDVAADDQTLNL
jgi:hypothetical protein